MNAKRKAQCELVYHVLKDDLAYQTARERQCMTNMTIVLRAHKFPYDMDFVLDNLEYDPPHPVIRAIHDVLKDNKDYQIARRMDSTDLMAQVLKEHGWYVREACAMNMLRFDPSKPDTQQNFI